MAFKAIILGLGPLFYILLGFRYGLGFTFEGLSRVIENNFKSQFKASWYFYLYESQFRVRSGDAALNCPGLRRL